MDNAGILQPLLEKGDLKQTIELAEIEHRELIDIYSEGMNIVTASILADIPPVHKMPLIRKVGGLFPSEEYCSLLNQKLFTLRPEARDKLTFQGVVITKESILPYCDWFNIFEIAFPWLPLSVFEDFVVYLREDKKLVLDKETIETVRENFENCKKYRERELESFFSSNIFDSYADDSDDEEEDDSSKKTP